MNIKVNNLLQVRAFIVHEVMSVMNAAVNADKVVEIAQTIENYMIKGIRVPKELESDQIINAVFDRLEGLAQYPMADLSDAIEELKGLKKKPEEPKEE